MVSSLIIQDDVLVQWQVKATEYETLADLSQLEKDEKQVAQAIENLTFLLANGVTGFLKSKSQMDKLRAEQKRLRQLREQHDALVVQDSKQASNLVTTALALKQIIDTWQITDDDQRNTMISRVFEWICYDIDLGEITEFKMVQSAEAYLGALLRNRQI